MRTLEVNIPNNKYDIEIEKGLLNRIGERLTSLYKDCKIALITDSNVYSIHGQRIISKLNKHYEVKTVILEPGEKSKSIKTLMHLYNELLDFGITKSDLIITFGGGVIGDVGGYCAATFLRGIPYIQIPTTLLSQVDSSIGGKVAINFDEGKNLIGSFYQPCGVFIDTDLLETLDEKYFIDGLGEVIKYGCICDKDLFNKLLSFQSLKELKENITDIVYTCCDIKRRIVEKDERDNGERMLLNFGHTIGHGIESYYKYKGYSHGQCVAMGMYNISAIGAFMGITTTEAVGQIKKVLNLYELPYKMPNMDIEVLVKIIFMDKKMTGETINLIMLEDIGLSKVISINRNEVRKLLIKGRGDCESN